jgi:hypothetical protein
MLLFRETVFCPAPAGDSITRKSIFDSLIAGCIPVIFARASMSQYLWFFTKEEVSSPELHCFNNNSFCYSICIIYNNI